MIVLGCGLSPDDTVWVACKFRFFLHVRVLSRLFRRLFLKGLFALHRAGQLAFFSGLAGLAEAKTFTTWLVPFRKSAWVVYAKPPFGGPETLLAYLSRYTHRVAISKHRLVSADAQTVAFRWKDYRIKSGDRQKVMRLATPEFIRRFLIHVLPLSHTCRACAAGQWRGSTASGIIACWQARRARPTSERSAPYSASSVQTRSPPRNAKSRSSHSHCANNAPVAVAPCASSRSFVAGKSRYRARHHESDPLDTPLVRCHSPPPAAHLRPGHDRLRPSSFGAKHDSSHAKSLSVSRLITRVCSRLKHYVLLQQHP